MRYSIAERIERKGKDPGDVMPAHRRDMRERTERRSDKTDIGDTMNVLLIDADSTVPNLALMKISAYHKSLGDNVGFNVEDPDKVYCSIIFKKNKHIADGLRFLYPDAELDIGGSGYDLHKVLSPEIECMTPDYSLYPDNTSYYGFTTRGCIRHCPFCIVHDKEGLFRRIYGSVDDALESIMGNYNLSNITFFDNNILADKDWFIRLCNTLHDRFPKMKVDFNQGLDVRLLDDDMAMALSKLKPITKWKFAFDMMGYKDKVLSGIEILNRYIKVRSMVLFYVYVDNDDQIPDAVARSRILKENGATAYAMLNLDVPHTKRMKAFKRWTRPWLFWSCDFDEFYKG